jgi:AraC-like DNA-binding protein
MAFGRHFGVAPKTYLNRRLNEEILRTLAESDASMREIAERFGFNDEYYFNRFFKKMNGRPPLRFRHKFLAEMQNQ